MRDKLANLTHEKPVNLIWAGAIGFLVSGIFGTFIAPLVLECLALSGAKSDEKWCLWFLIGVLAASPVNDLNAKILNQPVSNPGIKIQVLPENSTSQKSFE